MHLKSYEIGGRILRAIASGPAQMHNGRMMIPGVAFRTGVESPLKFAEIVHLTEGLLAA